MNDAWSWMDDPRLIKQLQLGDEKFDRACGDRFERFEVAGDNAWIPWVRLRTWYHNNISVSYERCVEFPLARVLWIEYESR